VLDSCRHPREVFQYFRLLPCFKYSEIFNRGALLQTPDFLIHGGASMPPINNFYTAYGFFYSSRLSPAPGSLKSSSPPVPHSPASRFPPAPGSPTPPVTRGAWVGSEPCLFATAKPRVARMAGSLKGDSPLEKPPVSAAS